MEVFFKGADIVLELSLWNDEKRNQALDLSSYIVDAVLYGSDGNKILLSSADSKGIKLEVLDAKRLQATLNSEHLLTLKCGVIHIEVRLKDKTSGLSVVDRQCAFNLEDSKIKDIE